MEDSPRPADIDVEVRGSAVLKRRHAAPVSAGLLAALLLVAGGAAARSDGAPRNLAAPKILGKAQAGNRL